jgi:hypothetical protein
VRNSRLIGCTQFSTNMPARAIGWVLSVYKSSHKQGREA